MIALPPQPHLPGRTPRPPEDLFAPLKGDAQTALAAGLEAFRRRYYWEAHELWEPAWMALPPASAERCVLRGLIQLANAGLKARMGRDAAATRIRALADATLDEGLRRGGAASLGLDPPQIAALRQQAKTESQIEI